MWIFRFPAFDSPLWWLASPITKAENQLSFTAEIVLLGLILLNTTVIIAGGLTLMSMALKNREYILDLWVWHGKEDEDGVKLWYIPRSMEKALIDLRKSIEAQTRMIEYLDRRTSE